MTYYVVVNLVTVTKTNMIVRARTPAFGLLGIRMVILGYGCKRGCE